MNGSIKVKTLAVTISLLAGSQSALALTPWVNGTPDVLVYTSGGAAQDQAYAAAVAKKLAAPGSLDTFEDENGSTVGGRFAGYYFTGAASLPNNLAGKKIFLEKRSHGAAGYGAVPLAGGLGIDHLNIFIPDDPTNAGTVGSAKSAAWVANGSKKWKAAITTNGATNGQSSWKNYVLSDVKSHGGFLGVDAEALLLNGTQNYPDPVKEISQASGTTPGWALNLTSADLDSRGVTRHATGGLVYGVGVTLDLYKALQAAQWYSGKLPADANSKIGEYTDERYIPSLNRNFLAAVLSGQIKEWSDVKVDDGSATGLPLNHASILATAGLSATPPSNYKVAVGRRNTGAAIGAVAYAKLLNYPFVDKAFSPAGNTSNTAAVENLPATKPIVKSPAGARATDNLLVDWQTASNSSTLNPASKKYWGLAVHSGDRNGAQPNNSPSQPWRYVKIDGFTPTISNVASGDYPYWAEGQVLARSEADIAADSLTTGDVGGNADAKRSLLLEFANALGSSDVAVDVNANLVHPFGQSGVFATTRTDATATVSIPFDSANPVVGLSHNNGDGYTHLGIAPTPYKNGAAVQNTIELK